MRRLLRVPEGPARVREDAVYGVFSTSVVLSGLRCLLSYVVLPFVTPLLGAAAGAAPAIGIPVGLVALIFDVKGARRFWLAGHRWRWPMTGLYAIVTILVAVLVGIDAAHAIS
jgi:hypothetical protein